MAAQLTLAKLWFLRLLQLWIARAMSSLPVPVSPSSSTVESPSATCSTICSTLRSAELWPMIPSNPSSLGVSSLTTLKLANSVPDRGA